MEVADSIGGVRLKKLDKRSEKFLFFLLKIKIKYHNKNKILIITIIIIIFIFPNNFKQFLN